MMRPRSSAAQVDGASVQHFPPGIAAQAPDFLPGDFILTHGDTLLARFIRLGQSLAFAGRNRKYIWWSHAALIVSAEGALLEALTVAGNVVAARTPKPVLQCVKLTA